MTARPRGLQRASQTPVAPAGGAAQGEAGAHACFWGDLLGHQGTDVELDQGSYFPTYLPPRRGPQHHLGSAWCGPGLVRGFPSPAHFPPSNHYAHWCWGPFAISIACGRGEGLEPSATWPSVHVSPQGLLSVHVCTVIRPDLPHVAHTAHDRAAPCCGPTRRRYGPRHPRNSAKRAAAARGCMGQGAVVAGDGLVVAPALDAGGAARRFMCMRTPRQVRPLPSHHSVLI
jgi:hypothetical protein